MLLDSDYPEIGLNVARDNYNAIKLYEKFGFVIDNSRMTMKRII